MDSNLKLRVEDATKYYGTRTGPVHAVENVSFDVREGEMVCVLGPSGCGKTTLLWSMAGLHSLTRGRILIDGTPVTKPHPQVAMMFQEANLLPWVPGLASQMKPPVAVESMMQLANVFRGNFDKRKGWGWHDEEAWGLFFKTIKDIGQIHGDIKVADVIKNDYVAGANTFDKGKVKADADGYKLPDDYASIDVEAIRKAL